ncbi:MAG: amino-acid N-acetyltransferase [Kiritimatiellae bacterium]|nr:amino-acid N-acetyltransferase [Kiritimatiellia bacterium]MDW8457539.1 amino-acid N-acetyltransferase [Verrucomicrobiota bacterium]
MRASDLRGILRYTARFRDRLFVLNVDSAVLASDNFRNLLLDISVLRSLNIRIVLVHGCSVHIRALSEELNIPVSDFEGMGITDAQTLRISILAAHHLAHEILEGLADTDQRAVITNAIIAHPAGILNGVDHLFTGRVERVDAEFLNALLEQEIIPIVPPLGFDGNGQTYRVNSDGVALEVAEALRAAKLIHVTTNNGVREAGKLSAQFSIEEAEEYIRKYRDELPPAMLSKLQHGVRACRNGVQRVHIIDGTQDEALLGEIFSNEGVGTMIHANEYVAIRPARKKDAGVIMKLIRDSIEQQQLLPRTRKSIEERISDFFVFEIDRNVVGCVALRQFPGEAEDCAELECLYVAEAHENQGIGAKLMLFVEDLARERGARRLLALSTQAFNYFTQKGGFREGTPDMLPPSRRALYEKSGRRSKILYKDLA